MQKMKYKVLAADDEYWSRENLRSLISWEDYAIKFLDPACDGEEVLERIKEEKPDIILTDINMPFLDGLELLKKLQTEYPQIITIAVSGYDDFEKVKGVFVSGGKRRTCPDSYKSPRYSGREGDSAKKYGDKSAEGAQTVIIHGRQ